MNANAIAARLLAHGPIRDGWADDAECRRRGMVPAEFFMDSDDGNRPSARVVAACAACPVWNDCLLEALTFAQNADHGIRAGMGTRQRRYVRAAIRNLRREAS